ncbi:histone H2A deubiquitinase MYSM1 [Betta splendens]|uniref:Myb-like, SWIRM and MPN domain-containing protein 1 n=1 Tax=Betta splendens TaxID=158456 RepID=A0A6P7M6N5_BETSP|nr:histone H2A deubiquitinase MYSM1 [Betta splendens]
MEDEVDVDIEGDVFESPDSELDGAALAQEQLLQSAWRSSAGMLPWELDNSISPENREAIERMLLEEQYYLTGKGVPDHIWGSDVNHKAKVKRSPAKSSASASSSRWSKQEKALFEEGLAQFGRRWTKIAKLVGSRTVLQVKSYARQYFKHKGKAEPKAAAPSAGPMPELPHTTSSLAHVVANTVRIEKLSDDEDEDVDITDEPGDDANSKDKQQIVVKTEFCEAEQQAPTEVLKDRFTDEQKEEGQEETKDQHSHTWFPMAESPQSSSSHLYSEEYGVSQLDEKSDLTESCILKNIEAIAQKDLKQMMDMTEGQGSHSEGSSEALQLEESCQDGADSADETKQSVADKPAEAREEEDEVEDEEEEELKIPEQEIEMDVDTITEEEKQAIPEFFEGRPSKTPERYLKIRNYILDQWWRSRPKYLNKTSVRPGLKNCGDVNCIGRIHTYLELIGAINFHCEQAVYNRPKVVDRSKHKEGKDVLEAYQLAQRLQSMRTRKRRVRDTWGNWRDPKDLEGQTYEHFTAEEQARRREEMKKQSKLCRTNRYRGSLDPFQLIPCRSFGEDVQEPFQVIVCTETLLIMDMHAHVSRCEVIGLLGGIFKKDEKVLKICAAEPCNSVSTGLQCEMDPVSQTQACDVLSSLGFSVVGWYHSHPSFHPNPSVRDISTQDQFQSYFSRGGAPFIGMIVSPYDPANPSPHSQTTCLLVRESQEPSAPQKLPFGFDFLSSQDIPDWEQTMRRAHWIINKYSQSPGSVQMNRRFRRDSHLTCLEKMLSSLARYMEPLPDEEGEPFLTQIQSLFHSDFIAKQHQQEEAASFSRLVDSDDLSFDQGPQMGDCDQDCGTASDSNVQPTTQSPTSDTNSSTVLHLGSVLSPEHDYLL